MLQVSVIEHSDTAIALCCSSLKLIVLMSMQLTEGYTHLRGYWFGVYDTLDMFSLQTWA